LTIEEIFDIVAILKKNPVFMPGVLRMVFLTIANWQ
jgi:hypothetical protein